MQISTRLQSLQEATDDLLVELHTSHLELPPLRDIQDQSRLRHEPTTVNRLEAMAMDIATLLRIEVKIREAREELRRRDAIARNHLLSPTSMIPPEILGRVFRDVAEGHDTLIVACDALKQSRQLLNISQVSQQWRVVALNYQVLWTHIHSSFSTDMTRVWLERAGRLPLHVHLEDEQNVDRIDENADPTISYRAYDKLINLSDHGRVWKTLCIQDHGSFYMDALNAGGGNLPSPEVLLLAYAGWRQNPYHPVLPPWDCLRHLTLSRLEIPLARGIIQNLVTLQLDPCARHLNEGPARTHWMRTLPEAQMLEKLILKGQDPPWYNACDDPPDSFILPKLSTLSLEDVPIFHISTLLRVLRAPHLKTLRVREIDRQGYHDYLEDLANEPVDFSNFVSIFPFLNLLGGHPWRRLKNSALNRFSNTPA